MAAGAAPAVAPAPAAAAAAAAPGVVSALSPDQKKKRRVVSGPECECCGVRFTGDAQLDEHRKGKRHEAAARVFQCARAPPLAIECRQAPLEVRALRTTFEPFGALEDAALSATNPMGGSESGRTPAPGGDDGAQGPWFATVRYKDAACAAKALGQKMLYVGGKRVYVEAVPGRA